MNATPHTAIGSGLNACLLVELSGRVLAATPSPVCFLATEARAPEFLQDLIPGEQTEDALRQIAAGAAEATIADPTFVDDQAHDGPTLVRFRRLSGPRGDWALVEFVAAQTAPAIDALTGLPDRRAIADRLRQWQTRGGSRRTNHALLFVDLDDFKRINDKFGHAVGDEVLATVAQRLAGCVREGDLVARYGGDEFVILLHDVATEQAAAPVVERLTQCVREPIATGERQHTVTATIGVSILRGDADRAEDAINAADRNMYAQKRRRPK